MLLRTVTSGKRRVAKAVAAVYDRRAGSGARRAPLQRSSPQDTCNQSLLQGTLPIKNKSKGAEFAGYLAILESGEATHQRLSTNTHGDAQVQRSAAQLGESGRKAVAVLEAGFDDLAR